jgi:hypothetical protein
MRDQQLMNTNTMDTASPENPVNDDDSLAPFLAQLDEQIAQPYKTQADRIAEEQAKRANYQKLVSGFDNSEIGQRLHQIRFDTFVIPLMQRFAQESQTMTAWACDMAGELVEKEYANSMEYKAWEHRYNEHFNNFVKNHGGLK